MEALSSLDCIDPNLVSVELLGVDGNCDIVYHDQPSTLASNPDLDLTFDSISIPSSVRCDPSDRVWNTADQEENMRLLLRNSILADFPFPPRANPSNNDKTLSSLELSADSCPPPPKRRRRKRKAPLSEAEKEEKRRKFLERNRVAASKCRAKKKTELECLEDRKIALGRENEVLGRVLRKLWAEVRLYRDAVMAHASCNTPDVVEWHGHNANLSAVCQSLLAEGDDEGGLDAEGGLGGDGGLDFGGSQNSSIDDSQHTLLLSEDGGAERSSMSSFPSLPPSPAGTLKEIIR
jgi:hypothetical protein